MSRRRLGLALLVALTIGAVAAGIAVAGKGNGDDKTFEYSVGLWGDLPYNDVQAQTGVPNLIVDRNNSDISFSIHDGDLKAGSGTPGSVTPTTCGDALYEQRQTARTTSSSGCNVSGSSSSPPTSRSAGRR
jgi:hypothetical protein